MAGHFFCLCVWTSYCDTPMMMSSNGNIFRVTGYLCGEFTGHRWLTRTKACGAELWRFLWSADKKRVNKQSWGWWFATPSRSLLCHGNAHWLDLIVFCTIQQIVGIYHHEWVVGGRSAKVVSRVYIMKHYRYGDGDFANSNSLNCLNKIITWGPNKVAQSLGMIKCKFRKDI